MINAGYFLAITRLIKLMIIKDLKYNPYLPKDPDFFNVNKAKLEIDFKKYKNKPVFSVIIPTFNKKKSLELVLNSFFKQDYLKTSYEIIVIDDGSTDRTLESIKNIKPNCNFKYFYWPRKKIKVKKEYSQWARFYNRVGLARNIGLKNARGKIILFNDADILVNQNCLKKHQDYHNKYFNVIVRGFRMFLPRANFIDRKTACPEKSGREKKLCCRMYNLSKEGWYRVITSNLSVRKKYLDRICGFSHDFVFWGFEDVDLGYRLSRGPKLKLIWDDKIKVYHLWHPRESGSRAEDLLTLQVGANILYNKYLDEEIISVFDELIRNRL